MKLQGKSLAVVTLLVGALSLAGCGGNEEPVATPAPSAEATPEASAEPSEEPEATPEAEASEKGKLMMATTTSTDDTGLLDYLEPIFEEATGYDLEWASVGTGEALRMGEDGEVDVVLVHAKASEEAFVADGYGVERVPVMYNDFVVVGPETPIEKTDDIASVFSTITEDGLNFVSRGDDSGTHKKEVAVWKNLGIDPTTNANFVESGQGMGASLTMADETNAYCLTDRGTYLKQKSDATVGLELDIVCEGAADLLNQYGIIAVNPEKYEDTNIEGANAFIDWICEPEVQELIGEFGVDKYGQPLFVPNAGTES